MSSVRVFRDFVRERLTAAAEEIFSVFEQTIVQYEEEIGRHRNLLDIKTELPHHGPCHSLTEVLSTQDSYDQETNSRLDMEAPELSEIKEEQDDFCTSQDEEQLELKQESDALMMPSTYVTNYFSETAAEQLLFADSAVAEKQDQRECEDLHSGPFTKTELLSKNNENNSQRDIVHKSSLARIHEDSQIGKKTAICNICGKKFQYQSQLKKHQRTHTGEKPYPCERCGKNFRSNGHLVRHRGTRSCETLKSHMLTHASKRPYSCEVCGKGCSKLSSLKIHARTHTGEKPYCCHTCGKRFNDPSSFKRHINLHKVKKQQS